MSAGSDAMAHWDDAYAEGEDAASWFQAYPTASLKMLDAAGVSADDSVIDVGGGASRFVDALIGREFRDVTVLDISGTGMRYAQQRLGARAEHVQWVVADLLTWQPPRRYRVWHDRAVFHFLTSQATQSQYLDVLEAATEPDSVAVFGLFAPDGPQRCSGLPVARYSATTLTDRLGVSWKLVCEDREEHTTPRGRPQPFTWAALRKQPIELTLPAACPIRPRADRSIHEGRYPGWEEAAGAVPDEDKKRAAQRVLVDRVLNGEGRASPELRARAFSNTGLPAPLQALIGKVASSPGQITDADFTAAKAAGFTEDQLFELVISAAVGQSDRLYEAGLAALAEATGAGEADDAT